MTLAARGFVVSSVADWRGILDRSFRTDVTAFGEKSALKLFFHAIDSSVFMRCGKPKHVFLSPCRKNSGLESRFMYSDNFIP